jgi:hypothetical protein
MPSFRSARSTGQRTLPYAWATKVLAVADALPKGDFRHRSRPLSAATFTECLETVGIPVFPTSSSRFVDDEPGRAARRLSGGGDPAASPLA